MLLHGIRILDLTRLLPGGYCTQLLQEQGAHVIKVEAPSGDPIRRLPGGPAFFDALHKAKELVVLDLRRSDGRAAVLKLVAEVDVVVEGFRPGVMERLQLGYEQLSEVNPGLIHCAITGYGSGGALAKRAGHDLNYLARSGVLSLMPRIDGQPVIPGFQVADLAGGLEAAFLIASALAARARTGKGSRVEVSMTHLMRRWTVLPRAARRAGLQGIPLTGELPCYHVYRVADGFLTVAALEPEFWGEFCNAIERPDLIERQLDPSAIPDVDSVLLSRTRVDWIRIFGTRDVCVEPVLTLEESEAS